MKYFVQRWDKENDGILYFIQRLEEMLFHYSDDIVKAPVHNTATLILEYIQVENEENVQPFHLDIIVEELTESLRNDQIIKNKLGANKVQKLIEVLKYQTRDAVYYLSGCISFLNYYSWCVEYILEKVKRANEKEEICFGLRAWISSLIRVGYTPEYIYRFLREKFNGIVVDNPNEAFEKFIKHFATESKNYRVYFLFMSSALAYKDLLAQRLRVVFEDDGLFKKIIKKDNKAFVGYLEVEAIDPYQALQMAYGGLNIFISFYRVLSNRKKELIGKNAMVRNIASDEEIKIPVGCNGYNTIEPEPKHDFKEQIDHAVIGCQNKPETTYEALNKIINLHNMALKQDDLSDGFVNLWSTLEVACKEIDKKSKIEMVLHGVLPMLQNDFFEKYFNSVTEDLKHALSRDEYNQLLTKITQAGTDVYKITCFVFLEEYEELRELYFKKLECFPNIRQKIYKMYKCKDKKNMVYALSENYAKRLKWHLYRLYRVRNAIVHAGENDPNIQILGEHLHIYCDGVIIEIISKLAENDEFYRINDVLLDARLLIEAKKEHFSLPEKMEESDIAFMMCSYFQSIEM